MGQVTVTVNGRAYVIGCDDGAEAHVRALGQHLNDRVAELAQAVGQVGEARLLLMAALTISDDLSVLSHEQEDLKRELADLRAAVRSDPPPAELAGIVERLERVADKLENA